MCCVVNVKMSKHIIKRAKFRLEISKWETKIIEVCLCQRDKTLKDYLLVPEGTYWIESNMGYNSGFYHTRKRAEYEFSLKCLYHFYEEMNYLAEKKSCEETERIANFYAYNGGSFEYFHPETKDYKFISRYDDSSDEWEWKIKSISKAIGSQIPFSKLPNNYHNALQWEITPNKAILYKMKLVEFFDEKGHFKGYRNEGNKEEIFRYPNSKELLMIIFRVSPDLSSALHHNLNYSDN